MPSILPTRLAAHPGPRAAVSQAVRCGILCRRAKGPPGPRACGFGMSERVFTFFMDKSVRECQIFPLLRPLDTPRQP